MLKDLIELNVHLTPSRNGWYSCKCGSCNDYKKRGGFNFDGDTITYNCFNCGLIGKHVEGEPKVSKNMRKALVGFGITDTEIDNEIGKTYIEKQGKINTSTSEPVVRKCTTPEIELPAGSYLLSQSKPDDVWATVAKEWLATRNLSVDVYPWYLSTDKDFRDRIIIPIFRNDRIIYWQARSFDEKSKLRYVNPVMEREAVLYGYNVLESYEDQDKPIFVTEGFFDGIHLNGIALLGSKFTECKTKALNKSRRKKIFVIDKDKNGYQFGTKALEQGHAITYIPGDLDLDVDKAIGRYGKLWTISTLMANVKEGIEGKLLLENILVRWKQENGKLKNKK